MGIFYKKADVIFEQPLNRNFQYKYCRKIDERFQNNEKFFCQLARKKLKVITNWINIDKNSSCEIWKHKQIFIFLNYKQKFHTMSEKWKINRIKSVKCEIFAIHGVRKKRSNFWKLKFNATGIKSIRRKRGFCVDKFKVDEGSEIRFLQLGFFYFMIK